MKISCQAYGGENNINSYGGLEVRFSVNWADWFRRQGHQVHFFHQSIGCDDSYDLCFDAPISDAYPCAKWRAKKHIHSYFSPDVSGLTFLDCYKAGNAIMSHPTTFSYKRGLELNGPGFRRVFTPIPYLDCYRPSVRIPSFDRTEIMWCNKGNFAPQFGEDHYYYINGIRTLEALVRLNKKVDFKITLVLRQLIEQRPEVRDLLSQLKNVELLGQISWINLVDRMSRCKINTHAGGLTSAIFESVFCETVPLVPNDFGFFGDEAREANLMPNARVATTDEIYDALERLWLDKDFYSEKNNLFQEGFTPHRDPSTYWSRLLEEL